MHNRDDHLDEGTIHAWLDGELPPDESTRISMHLEACTECSAGVAEARGLIAASSRILSALDAVPGGVIPGIRRDTDRLAEIRRRAAMPRSGGLWRHRQFLAAASLVLMAGAAAVTWRLWPGDTLQMAPAVGDPSTTTPAVTSGEASPSLPVGTAPARPRDEALREQVQSSETGVEARTDFSASRAAPMTTRAETDPVGAGVQGTGVTGVGRSTDSTVRPAGAPTGGGADGMVARARSPEPIRQKVAASAFDAMRMNERNDRKAERPVAPPQALRAGAADSRGSGLSVDHGGCYLLRGPGPVNTVLLGVPELVNLLNERSSADSLWKRAVAPGVVGEGGSLPFSILWRSIDSTVVELRVRRALDSTVVWFKATLSGTPLEEGHQPSGVVLARGARVVCPG